MFLRMLPGLVLSALLGLLLSALPGTSPASRSVSAPGVPMPDARPESPMPPGDGTAGTDREKPAASSLPGAPRPTVSPAVSPETADFAARLSAMPSSRRTLKKEVPPLAPESTALAVPAILSGGGVASSTALASVTGSGSPVMPVCPAAPTPRCPDPPARGLYFWASGSNFKERQKEYGAGLSIYENKGDLYSAGFMMDWSIDATVGLSFDLYSSELKSLHEADSRKSDIEAYTLNAHYHATLWEKYLLRVKFLAGRSQSGGRGTAGSPFQTVYVEEKHRSILFGGSAMLGLPLIFGDDIKLIPEFGLRWTRLKSDSYTLRTMGMHSEVVIPKRDDTSVSLPATLEVKRDFAQFWGTVTPRLNLGMTLELDESALGVRSFNAAAASTVIDPLNSFDPPLLVRDSSAKTFFNLGIGVDLLTRGGWDIRADLSHQWGGKYDSNTFRLEMGRCF